jgi:hypothetical protein
MILRTCYGVHPGDHQGITKLRARCCAQICVHFYQLPGDPLSPSTCAEKQILVPHDLLPAISTTIFHKSTWCGSQVGKHPQVYHGIEPIPRYQCLCTSLPFNVFSRICPSRHLKLTGRTSLSDSIDDRHTRVPGIVVNCQRPHDYSPPSLIRLDSGGADGGTLFSLSEGGHIFSAGPVSPVSPFTVNAS